jgi:DNA-binding IclR family transcriptional regulator
MAGGAAQPGVTVASRVVALLTAFNSQHPRLTLTQLAHRAGLPVPTAHRLVGELTAAGLLSRQSDGAYAVGRRMWDVGLLAPGEADLREVASPFMHDLYAATLATVHLAVREGLAALYLDRLAGQRSVPVVSRVGTRLPLHATGVGKVLLAYAPAEVQELALSSLERLTPYTVIQPGRLRRQLEAVRRDGWASTVEEMTLGACSVAVPVRRGDEVVAALGVVVPDLRRDRTRLVTALQVAAHGTSRSLAERP